MSEWASERRQADDVEPPQLVVQQFSMEALHNIMLRNGSQMLGLYDEMSVMYGQLDAYKHSGSTLDRSTLLDLYNGGSWARNFKNKLGPSKMLKTAFNMSGFIQPAFVVSMLDKCDADGFNDRQLFDCPEEVEYKYKDLKVPMDESIPSLSLVFKVLREVHQKKRTYTMNEEAMDVFIQYHDGLVDRKKAIPDDENRRGILSKAKGQCARLSMIQYVLSQAVEIACDLHQEQQYGSEDISSKCSTWSTEVIASAVTSAVVITNHFIQQKFLLMPPELVVAIDTDVSDVLQSNYLASHLKTLKRFLLDKGTIRITASEVCRRRLIPPKPLSDASPERKTKYPVDAAKVFMKDVANEGFRAAERVKSGAKESLTFKKRKFEELEGNSLEILKRLKISKSDYLLAQAQDSSVSVTISTPGPAISTNSLPVIEE